MRKLLVCFSLVALLAGSASAYQPSGWVCIDWPWAFDATSGDWHWFNTSDTQWVNGFAPADGWRELPQSALATGWSFHGWPFAFCSSNSAWYYINEVDTQWVVNMRTGVWSRFGQMAVPDGMVLIPAGVNSGTDPDFGAYSLTNAADFYMDATEVTKAQWDSVYMWATNNSYGVDNAGSGKATNHPVHTVNWYDCVKWCNARSQKDGRTPVYYTDAAMTQVYKSGQVLEPYVKAAANGYRLPTDVQWEYAARGGVSSRRFSWGESDNIQHARANYYSSSSDSYDTSPTRGWHPTYETGDYPYTSPVGSFAGNAYGLYDMAGNVWEWCYDWYPGEEGSNRVLRGGSWIINAYDCRVGSRGYYGPYYAYFHLGFRACLPSGQ